MAVKRIKFSNFKSFKELDVELGDFNVIIGANASGKSNFTQAFKFLKDIEAYGLKDAISISGGLESLRNLKIGESADLEMDIVLDTAIDWGLGKHRLRVHQVDYGFTLEFPRPKNGYQISRDQLTHKFKIGAIDDRQKELFEGTEGFETGSYTITNVDGKLEGTVEPPQMEEGFEKNPLSFLPMMFKHRFFKPELLIRIQSGFMRPWGGLLGGLSKYNIDPHQAKNPVQITGKAELAENGENLALVLNNILEDDESKRKLCNLLSDILPFVKDVGTERFAEKSLMIQLQENYFKDKYLPAYLLSDGTVNIVAIIIALYFEDKDVVIIEEPERYIHPHLVSRLTDMMKDASKNKQVIVTTHSPEVVKHAGLENLLLVSRDSDGFSTITRPSEKAEIKVFLENDMGLDELYVQNLLAV